MREDDRTGVSETRPDRQYRMPPCPIHSQFRVVGHDLGGRTHRTCPLSDFEPPSTWLKGATWEIPVHFVPTSCSWLNAVEGFFAKLSKRRLKGGVFRSIVDLQVVINRFLDETNDNPKAFTWTADPDKIIAAVKRGHQVLDSIH